MKQTGYDPFATAQAQFDRIADMLSLEPSVRELLREPLREYRLGVPVRMDDGSVRVFRCDRIQHNDARGPAKGGIRFHPTGTHGLVKALAMWMTWTCAVLDLPLGGSSGGVACDPHDLSQAEQERLCRAWVKAMAGDVGPWTDVPEPDVGTGPQHMLWMLDEYESFHRMRTPGFTTGKPPELGGSLGRREATGYGVVFLVREALKNLGMPPDKTVASVQGFGKVGRSAVRLLTQIGGRVTSIASWDPSDRAAYTYRRESGVDPDELEGITDALGGIDADAARRLGYEVLPADAWLEQNVDLLIPAALENQITGENVEKVNGRVRLLVEAANGPTAPEADAVLSKRNVMIVPHVIAAAGGVTGSYFEQVQSNANYYWDRDEVLGKLDQKMTNAWIAVDDLARKRKLFVRDAALVIGVDRVASACRARGWV